MKKIYILTAVFALLTLSLNAQDGPKVIDNIRYDKAPTALNKAQGKTYIGKNTKVPTINELVAGIKGMSGILPAISDPNGSSTSSGSMRAPLKINSDEYLIGPYTTNDFSTNGYGFPDAYGGEGQQIYMFSDMSRSDFEQYDGEEIVGFRFALAGNSSQTADLYEFYSWPYSTNGIFENANRHTWSIPELGGAQPVTGYDDIVITTNNGYIGFTSIIVYNGNNVVTQWVGSTNQTTTPTEWVWTNGSRFASNNDGSYYMTYGSSSGGGQITIPSSLFENCTGEIRLVISAGADSGYGSNNYQIDVNGDPKTVSNENPTFNQFTWTFTPTTALPAYMELAGGQWHEFYFDEPITFNVNDTIAGLYLGYRYWQSGSSSTGEFMYPVAVNPNSSNAGIVSYRYGVSGTSYSDITITPSGTAVNFTRIALVSGNTTIKQWVYQAGNYALPSTWSCSGSWSSYQSSVCYTSGTITIPASDFSSYSNVQVEITAYGDNASQSITVSGQQQSITTSSNSYTWTVPTTNTYRSGWWSENMNGDLAVQLIMKSSLPKIEVSPETLTINDSGTNNTFSVQGSNLGNDNVGLTQSGSNFVPTLSATTGSYTDGGSYWYFTPADGSLNGTVTMNYNGRDLSASETVTLGNNTGASATVTVNYVPDLYIYCDNGVSPWDFDANPAIAMTNQGNGIYTATLANIPDGSHILFGRAAGLTYYWEGDDNRLFFGAQTDGADWGYGVNNWGYLDTDPTDDYLVKYHPIYFPEGGSYYITIDANAYTFTITEVPAPENVVAVTEGQTATVTWDAPASLPYGLDPVSSYNVYLDDQLVGNVPAADPHTYDFGTLAAGNHTVEISAVYPGNIESELVPANFTILEKTATPTISVVDNHDGTYTITATGDGEVNLTVGNETASGTGSASVTITQGSTEQTFAVSATAQETGKLESDPATQNVTIPALPITPTPVITYNETATEMVITATGQGTVTLNVTGQQPVSGNGSVSITIPRTTEDQTVTATATAQQDYYQPSAQAQETITIHEAGRSPMPSINMTDNGDGSYTITITGTGNLAVYINDADHGGTAGDPVATGYQTVSFVVEEHSQAMSITVQATNQEGDLAISHTAEETYNIPAMTIDSGFQQLDPQPANASTPIDLSKVMFVDRFSKEIPVRNDHPREYNYYLQETQVRQRTSNSIPVEIQKTGSDGLGYYTLTEIDNDVIVGEYVDSLDIITHDLGLTMNVRNAAMDLVLQDDPMVYFYTVERSTAAYPDEADRKYLGVLQRSDDGTYAETLNPSYDYEQTYQPGEHIHLDTQIITGDYNSYLTYVPVVWSKGFDRVLYPTDHTHNSYGAPKWRTGVADVQIEAVRAERQLGTMGSTNWTEAGIPCSMYMIDTITVKGYMPTVNTMPYEPYMFRVFVESKNGKLRGYTKVGDGAEILDGTHYTGDGNGPQHGPICVWSEYVKGSTHMGFNGNEVTFSRGKVSEVDSLDHWIVPDYKNIMFAAEDTLLTMTNAYNQEVIRPDELNIFVRFYYIVEGADEGHVVGMMMRDGGEAPGGYGSESPGTSPSPSTAVHEIIFEAGDIISQKYYNLQGMESDKPFEGINIVVTRYSSGITRTAKVVR